MKTTGNSDNFGATAYSYYNSKYLDKKNTANSCQITVPSESATYFVYVNTINNCKDTASVDVTVTPVIAGSDVKIAVADDKTAICNGESVELTVSVENKDKYPGTITYAWSTGETTESITVSPNTTTTYNVHATLNGCTSDVSVGSQIVTVKQLPTFTPVNPDPVCSGMSNTVNITQSGTGNVYHYYSNEGLTSEVADATKVAAGEYWVTLTENGCTSLPQKVTATVNPSPTPKILVDGAELTGSLCAGTEITLTAEKTYSSSYTWTNVASGASAAQAKATIAEGSNSYGLTVSENGCEGTATLTVTGLKVPTATIADISGVCADSEVSLEATPVWSTGAGGTGVWTYSGEELTSTTEGGKIVAKTNVPAGKNVYTLKLTDDNGCEATKDVEVGGKKLSLAALTVNPQSVKVGNSVLVQASASWNDGTSINSTPISGENYTRVWKKIVSETETVLSGTGVNLTDYPNVDGTVYRVVAEKEGCRDSIESKPVGVTTDPFEFPGGDPNNAIASVDNRFDVCYGEDISANPVKLYVTVQGGSEEYAYTWKYPSTMTATANDDTLTITAIDYENFGNKQQISVEISDGAKTINANQDFSVRPIPQITINGANGGATVQACKEVALTLTAAIQGGGGNFTWSSGTKGASIAASTSTVGTSTYQVTAEYGGCSNTDSVKVQVNELPEVTLAAQVDGQSVEAVCPGVEIKLVAAVDGVDSPTFKWLQGASSLSGTQPAIAVNSKTTYGVEYTDATTTCKATTSVTVDVYEKVQLAIGVLPASQVCPGTEVTMTITNGDADTYVWASSDGAEDMSDVKGDAYTVTPTDRVTYTVNGKDEHGCEATSVSATLEVRSAPTLVLAQSTLHGCAGASVDMRNAVSSLGSATLKVKNAAGDVLDGTSVTEAGTYTLYIDGGSCSSNEETVEVQFHALPTVTLTADKTSVCLGEEVALSAEGAGGTTLDYTPHQSWRNTPTSSGEVSYTVTVKNEYECTATATTSVTVKPLPEVTIEDPGTVCAGAEVTLKATGAETYAWTGGVQDGTGESYKVKPTTTNKTYSVTGTKDGCQSDPVSRTLDVQEAPVLAVARRLEACVGTPVDLKGAFDGGSYTLTFYNKDKGAMAVTSIASVQLSDTLFYAKATVGNCASEFVPVRVTPKALPQFSISGARAICQGDETALTVEGNAASYAWSPAGKDNATFGAQMVVNPTVDTEYTVTATGQNACTAEAKWRVVVNSLPKLKWNSGNETALIKGQSATW
ncbi:MAG: hypothetical protein K2O69_05620, partial [Odoribacter sp.]|nr:hypothetical protein [Odoribacter sp.]